MKKRLIVIISVVVVMMLLGAYWTFNAMFPKAEPMKQLENSMLESVNIYDNENEEIVLSDVELQKFINYINGAVPTRTMSINDYPSARPYYVVEIKTVERIIRYMIYEENGASYAEIPYEGVYQIKRETMEILKQ